MAVRHQPDAMITAVAGRELQGGRPLGRPLFWPGTPRRKLCSSAGMLQPNVPWLSGSSDSSLSGCRRHKSGPRCGKASCGFAAPIGSYRIWTAYADRETIGHAMKSLLAKIAIRKGVGLYLGEHEVAVSKVAATPLGPVELAASTRALHAGGLGQRDGAVADAAAGPQAPRAGGGGAARQPHLLRHAAAAAPAGESTPEAVLQKALCSPNISVDDLTVDLMQGEVNKSPVTSVAACRKKYMAGIVATLTELGMRPFAPSRRPVPWCGWRHNSIAFPAGRRRCCACSSAPPRGWRWWWPAACRWPGGDSSCRPMPKGLPFSPPPGRCGPSTRITASSRRWTMPSSTVGRTCTSGFRKKSSPPTWGRAWFGTTGRRWIDAAMAQGLALGCLAQG